MQSEASITAKDHITDNWGPEVILTAEEQKTDSKKCILGPRMWVDAS